MTGVQTCALPIYIERRHGSDKPVIKKALVELDGAPFKAFAAARAAWAKSSDFRVPGPMQYFGSPEVTDRPTETILLEKGQMQMIDTAEAYGTEYINRSAAYGGVKQSGIGRKAGLDGVLEYSQMQTLTAYEV